MYLRGAHSSVAYHQGLPIHILPYWKWQQARIWFLQSVPKPFLLRVKGMMTILEMFTLMFSLLHQFMNYWFMNAPCSWCQWTSRKISLDPPRLSHLHRPWTWYGPRISTFSRQPTTRLHSSGDRTPPYRHSFVAWNSLLVYWSLVCIQLLSNM